MKFYLMALRRRVLLSAGHVDMLYVMNLRYTFERAIASISESMHPLASECIH